jgi:hypothetical protein
MSVQRFDEVSPETSFSMASRAHIWRKTFVRKMKVAIAAAALVGGFVALAPVSGASAAPVAQIGKAVDAVDSKTPVHYYRYYHRHRHCWWHHGRRFCRW